MSDGKMMLTLEGAEEGGYIVTSPLNPELITQAETIEEAFASACDAATALKRSRARLMRQLRNQMSVFLCVWGTRGVACSIRGRGSFLMTEPR